MKSRLIIRGFFTIALATIFLGCAALSTDERPVVNLTNLRLLESDGLSMRFAIDLALINPGPVAIPVQGLSWDFSLEGSDLLSGVTNQVPLLEPYTEVPITVEASTNLGGMLELFTRLMNRPDDQFDYELRTRLGVGGFRRSLSFVDSGSINISR